MAPYCYGEVEPNKREIRVLSLLPGKWHDPLNCQLEVVSLHDDPAYSALSYVWGNPNVTVAILLHGHIVQVTTNLEKALRRLRHSTETLVVWIDALCINQRDDIEKGHQVAMMGTIYEKCRCVFIWLGDRLSPGFDDSQGHPCTIHDMPLQPWNAIDPMVVGDNNFDELISGLGHVWAAFMMVYLLSKGKHIHEYSWFHSSPEAEDGFKALQSLMMLYWWSRVWVIQETVLPPHALVVWGSFRAPWAMFSAAARHFNRHVNSCCITSWIHMYNGLHRNILTFFAMTVSEFARLQRQRLARFEKTLIEFKAKLAKGEASLRTPIDELGPDPRLKASLTELLSGASFSAKELSWGLQMIPEDDRERGPSTLMELLWAFRNRNATDSRDKVYGVVSLVSQWHQNKPLIPNYRLNTRDVWALAVMESLAQNDFSIFMGKRSQVPESASWIPDWNQWTNNGQEINTIDVDTADKQHVTYGHYHASGNQAGRDYELKDGVLSLPGIYIDKVSVLSEIQFARIRKHRSTVATLQQWQTLIALDNHKDECYATSSCTKGDAFWRTVCRDMYLGDIQSRRAIVADQALFDLYFGMIAFERASAENPSEWNNAEKVMATVHTLTYNQKFFVTEKGYFGLGNPDTCVGDEVWILIGSKVPFILRPTTEENHLDNAYHLFGDCYLHGIMDGEMIAHHPEEAQTVSLL